MQDAPASRCQRDWLATILSFCLLGAPLFLTWWLFAELGGYPSNDDPFYGRPAQILADEGRLAVIRQNGELSASAVAHTVIGGLACRLTGFSYRTLFLAVIGQLWLSGGAIYLTAIAVGCRRAVAFALAMTYLATPLVFGHGFTFMTDGPAMAWVAFAVCADVRGFQSGRLGWLVVGSIATAVAFWMRQTHAVVVLFPIGTLLGLWWRGRSTAATAWGLMASTVVLIAAIAVFESGTITHGDARRLDDAPPDAFTMQQLKQSGIALYGSGLLMGLVALPLAPLVIAAAVREARTMSGRERWFTTTVASLSFAGMLTPFVITEGRACLTSATGMFVQNAHFGPIFLSDTYETERWDTMTGVQWPIVVWQLLTIAAIMSLSGLAWWIARNLQQWQASSEDPRVLQGVALLVVYPVVAAALVLLIHGVLDRYWMMLWPVAFVWLAIIPGPNLSHVGRATWGLTTAALLASLAVSVVFTHDFLSWNYARWTRIEQWLAEGKSPQDIDGGRDVNAWFRSAEDPDTFPRPGDDSPWWSGHATVALAASPRPGWRIIDRLSWTAWATGRQSEILVLEREAPSTP